MFEPQQTRPTEGALRAGRLEESSDVGGLVADVVRPAQQCLCALEIPPLQLHEPQAHSR